jgi:hypothetical protein
MIDLHLIHIPKNRPPEGHLNFARTAARDQFGTSRHDTAQRVSGRAKLTDVAPQSETGA